MTRRGRTIAAPTLLYIVAFNVAFFIQELFLVLPKALTPGLEATLYHNNHRWTGDSPLAALFQGTGALATIGVGTLAFFASAPQRVPRTMRLFLFWMAYCGWFMALPQFVIGAMSPGSDVGMAMDYFALSSTVKRSIAFGAVVAMPLLAFALTQRLLTFAHDPAEVATTGARNRFVFGNATLPALLAIVPLIAYRVPREWIEVLFLPVIVAVAGSMWMHLTAWRARAPAQFDAAPTPSPMGPAVAAIALLLAFQLVLRPGIVFG